MDRPAVDYLEGGDYENAIKYAHMSVTADEDGNELPVTPAGMNALIRSTYAYQVGAYCTPCMTIQLENELVAELISPERNFRFAYIVTGTMF